MQNAPNVFGDMVKQGVTWLREISAEMGGSLGDDYALQALRAALRALRDQLTVEQNAHLSAQLPTIVRGLYYEEWCPSDVPARDRHEEVFLERIPPFFHGKQRVVDPRDVARAVFAVLHRHISIGESEKIYHALPKEIRQYWPAHEVYAPRV